MKWPKQTTQKSWCDKQAELASCVNDIWKLYTDGVQLSELILAVVRRIVRNSSATMPHRNNSSSIQKFSGHDDSTFVTALVTSTYDVLRNSSLCRQRLGSNSAISLRSSTGPVASAGPLGLWPLAKVSGPITKLWPQWLHHLSVITDTIFCRAERRQINPFAYINNFWPNHWINPNYGLAIWQAVEEMPS